MKTAFLYTLLFFCAGTAFARPRFPFPKNADQVGQNDRDLSDDITRVQTLISTFTYDSSSGILCIDSPTFCVNVLTHVVSEASTTVTGSLTIGGGILALNTRGGVGYVVYVTSNSSLATSGVGLGADNNKGILFTNGAATSLDISLNGSAVAANYSSAGEITQPLQPSFLAVDGTGATDVTGDGTNYSQLWPTEIYDQNNDFNSSTFTAPVSGRYLLQASVLIQNMLVTHGDRNFRITTSNRVYSTNRNYSLAETNNTMSLIVIADMDAGDTASVNITISGSTKTVDIIGNATLNFFSGTLLN